MNESTSELPTATDWSQLYQHRRATQRRYKSIWQVPLRKRHHQVVRQMCPTIESLLELGAGSRNFHELMARHYPSMSYKSFDIDSNQPHDFYRLEDIQGRYDVVCMFEVIEHLSPTLAMETLHTAFARLTPGGLFFVSTPNTFNPPEYLRDATHITPWCYDELGGALQLAGFELAAIYRLYHESLVKRLCRRYLGLPLFRLLGLDFSKQIIAVGRKPT